METIQINKIWEAQIGDDVKFLELNLWGEVSNVTQEKDHRGCMWTFIEMISQNGDIISGLKYGQIRLYRDVPEGTEIECEECDGEGFIEIGPECSYPASMCCGGCYRNVQCEHCDGSGKIVVG